MIFVGRPRLLWCLLVAALLGQGTAMLATSVAGWYGWLPAAIPELEKISLWGAPLVGAATAAVAGSLRLHAAEDWALGTGRTRAQIDAPALRWGASACAVAAVLLTTAVLLVCRSSLTGEGVLRLGAAALAVVGVGVCSAAFGIVLARHLSPWLAPLPAFLAPYLLVMVLAGYLGGGPLSTVPFPSFIGGDVTWMSLDAHLLRCATAVATALWSWAALTRRARGLTRVAAGTSSLALAGTILTGGSVVPVPGSDRVDCTGTGPVVCLDATQEAGRSTYLAGVQQALDLLPKPLHPARITATDARQDPAALRVVPASGKYQPARRITAAEVTTQVGEAVFAAPCTQARAQESGEALTAWWRLRTGAPLQGGQYVAQADLTVLARQASLSRARAWTRLGPAPQHAAVLQAATALASCSRP